MSTASQGPGWWQASDGNWYPPEATPGPAATAIGVQIVAKGVTGTVTFDGLMLTITRSGLAGRMIVGKGEKTIPTTSITGVEWKPPGLGVRGFIRFGIPGAEQLKNTRLGQRATQAAKDENAVLFGKTQQAAFERLRSAVESALANRS